MQSLRVQKKQAALVKALSERMEQSDFLAYQREGEAGFQKQGPTDFSFSPERENTFQYIIERRDGSALQASINLDQSVGSILKSIVTTLEASGIAKSALPPQPARHSESDEHSSTILFAPNQQSQGNSVIDEQYNRVSNRGRDFFRFLDELNFEEIKRRKEERLEAQATALSVRRMFQFAAVDATSLGWSSASVAVLLRRMMDMHQEHHSRFHVSSFYPLRLVFSSDDFHDPLDIHGGLLRLNPACTTVQWIDTLRLIDPSTIEDIQLSSRRTLNMVHSLHAALGMKFRKGFSCSNDEYVEYLTHLCDNLPTLSTIRIADRGNDNCSIALPPLSVVVETEQACRRQPHVTGNGHIRIGTGMRGSLVDLVASIELIASQARQKVQEAQEEREQSRRIVSQLQWTFGLNRVDRSGRSGGGFPVSHSDFVGALTRMLTVDNGHDATHRNRQQYLQARLSGQSLSVVGSGQFCHLSDDGSMMVPHDWC